jgi:hypothetical protein
MATAIRSHRECLCLAQGNRQEEEEKRHEDDRLLLVKGMMWKEILNTKKYFWSFGSRQ